MLLIEVRCAACGAQLLGESYAGPPRRMFSRATAETLQRTQGWRDGLCPGCAPAIDPPD